jgi:hypothetical protein
MMWENVVVVALTMRVQIPQGFRQWWGGAGVGRWKDGLGKRVFSLWILSQYGNWNPTVFTEMHLGRAITWGISPFDSQLAEGCGTDQMAQVYASIQFDHWYSRVTNSLGNNVLVR